MPDQRVACNLCASKTGKTSRKGKEYFDKTNRTYSKKSSAAKPHSVCHPVALGQDQVDVTKNLCKQNHFSLLLEGHIDHNKKLVMDANFNCN